MDGSNKKGRPHREWSDDIEQWCGATLQKLSHAALDRQRWAVIVTMASDTNGVEPTVVDDDDDALFADSSTPIMLIFHVHHITCNRNNICKLFSCCAHNVCLR